MPHHWRNAEKIASVRYQCGYCGKRIESELGYTCQMLPGNEWGAITLCPSCSKPTYFDKSHQQHPVPVFGNPVNDVTTRELADLYDEARRCITASAYTASVLCSRKLLMNIAVSNGAEPGQSFSYSIEYLASEGIIPPEGDEGIHRVRHMVIEAPFEIRPVTREDAADLLTFTGMLLKFTAEFPSKIEISPKQTARPTQRIPLNQRASVTDWDFDT